MTFRAFGKNWGCDRDLENDVFVSVVTFWEVALKHALGKIELTGINPEDLHSLADKMGFDILEMGLEEALSFYRLPWVSHKDPFDRMIIWQAIRKKMILISKDRSFKEYKKHGLKIQICKDFGTFWVAGW